MEARPNSKVRLINFSKEPLGWPGDDDENFIDIDIPRNMANVALDIIQEPPTGATLLSSAPEDLNTIGQECLKVDMQRDLFSSSILSISNNDFTYTDLEALLKTDLEQIPSFNVSLSCLQSNLSLPNTSNFGSSLTAPSTSLQTPQGDYISPPIFSPGDTFRGEQKMPEFTYHTFSSPQHFSETVYSSEDYIPNPPQTNNTSNLQYPTDANQVQMQNTIAVPLPKAYQELQMEHSQTDSLSPEQEFILGSAQRDREISMLELPPTSNSSSQIPSQMTAEDAYSTSLATNFPFPPPSANNTSRSIAGNEQRLSSRIPSPARNDNTLVSSINQLVYSQLDSSINLLHPSSARSPGESIQPPSDIPQQDKFVYKHTLLDHIPVQYRSRDSLNTSSESMPHRPIYRPVKLSPQDVSAERRREKGKQNAVGPPTREHSSSIKRRQAPGPYYRPIRAKSPGPATSAQSPIDSTTDSPAPSPGSASMISESGIYLNWSEGMGETSTAPGCPINIPFDTRMKEGNIITGIAFSELKQRNFGLLAVSKILDNPNSTPLASLPTMRELFFFVEWPLPLGQIGQRHKAAKSDRPINYFSRVDILCKVAQSLYKHIREETNPLDPKKLRIMSLSQLVDKEDWNIKIAINSQQ